MAIAKERGRLARPSEEESWAMYQAMCRILPVMALSATRSRALPGKATARGIIKNTGELRTTSARPRRLFQIGRTRTENTLGVRLYEKELLTGHPPQQEAETLPDTGRNGRILLPPPSHERRHPADGFEKIWRGHHALYGDAVKMLKEWKPKKRPVILPDLPRRRSRE